MVGVLLIVAVDVRVMVWLGVDELVAGGIVYEGKGV
jgi:hypothetical protein